MAENIDYQQTLSELRAKIPSYIGGKRLTHTMSVEREAASLAGIFSLDETQTFKLRAAALLHDITKEKKSNEQLELCERFGIEVSDYDRAAPKTFHAKTGAALAMADFPDIADSEVASFIRFHTTGRENMTLGEKLLYLADYIEPERDFEDCKKLRRLFYDKLKKLYVSDTAALCQHLNRVLVASFDMTLTGLIGDGSFISVETVQSRNYLLKELYE